MEKNDNSSCRDLPADALVDVLLRLPPNVRRRFRLVCRLWRDLVNQRTATDMRRNTKIIAAGKAGLMFVVDLLQPGSRRDLFSKTNVGMDVRYNRMSIAGTCNGLVCLYDDRTPGGVVTVGNPSTGEALRLPPLPLFLPSFPVHWNNNNNNNNGIRRSWHKAFGFAYCHATRRYKVVNVPCHSDRIWQPGVVHVFTLGESSWRDVHTAGTDVRCSAGSSGIADVDDTMYWLADEAGKIMSFDLKHERLTRTEPLPAPAMSSTYHLAKVHGRLGVVAGDDDSVTVWVLEGERWSRRYVLELQQQEKWMMRRELVIPHLVHGDYFLTLTRESWSGFFVLYRHMMSETSRLQDDDVVQIRHRDRGEEVTCFRCPIYQVFSYVETKEPVSVYRTALVHN